MRWINWQQNLKALDLVWGPFTDKSITIHYPLTIRSEGNVLKNNYINILIFVFSLLQTLISLYLRHNNQTNYG
jgi:chaperonin GroEL (HSP60 family)